MSVKQSQESWAGDQYYLYICEVYNHKANYTYSQLYKNILMYNFL